MKPYAPKRSVTLTIVAINSDGIQKKESRNIQVNPPQQAQISRFYSPTRSITKGNQAKLCFDVSFDSLVSITNTKIQNEKSDGQEKCLIVTPQVTTEYSLYAVGPNRKRVDYPNSITITVNEPPGTGRLILGTNQARTELCYEVRNIQNAEITTPNRQILAISRDARQCFPITASVTTTYYLRGTDQNGQRLKESNVTILVPTILFQVRRHPQTGAFGLYYEVSDYTQARIVSPGLQAINLKGNRNFIPLPRNYSGREFKLQALGSHRTILRESTPVRAP